jgi:hypothetical protein
MDRRAWYLGLVGAALGGIGGFVVRGYLNSGEVIGFGNSPDQIAKLCMWAVAGAALGAGAGVVVARGSAVRGSA